jgi:hypothetical protein
MKRKSKITKKDLLVFIIGLCTYLQVRVIGTFGIAELIAIVFFPFIMPFSALKIKQLKKLIKYLVLGIFGLFISNLVNEVSLNNSLKGIFSLVIFLIDIFFAFWMFKDNYKRILVFMVGYALSNIIAFVFFPTSSLQAMIDMAGGENVEELLGVWYVYFIQPTMLIVCSILYYKGKKKLAILIILSFALYALFNSSRNIFLVWSLTALLLILLRKITNKNKLTKIKNLKRLAPIMVGIILIGLFGIKTSYEDLASNGTLGDHAQKKYLKQKYESGDLGLLSARIEFIVGLVAIVENPVIGYGSYPMDKTNLKERVYRYFNITSNVGTFEPGGERLSAHSHILNSYIYQGFLGVFFWIYAFALILRFIRRYLFYEPKMLAFFLLMVLSWLWDYFFSPFAFRLQEASLLVVVILVIHNGYKNRLKNNIYAK